MRNIIFVAPPAAGKGTQSDLLVKKYGYSHISTGDLLRNEINNKTELGKYLEDILASGALVSDEIVNELLKNKLSDVGINGFILDGYPRNITQALELDNMMIELNINDYVVIYLNMDSTTAMHRALGRVTCSNCNLSYNIYEEKLKPKVNGICDKCGGKLLSRTDDNEETFKVRFESYVENTKPLLKYYEDKGILFMVDNSGSTDNTFNQIESVINND